MHAIRHSASESEAAPVGVRGTRDLALEVPDDLFSFFALLLLCYATCFSHVASLYSCENFADLIFKRIFASCELGHLIVLLISFFLYGLAEPPQADIAFLY